MAQNLDTGLLPGPQQFRAYAQSIADEFRTPLVLERRRSNIGLPYEAKLVARDADALTVGRIDIATPEGYAAGMDPVRHDEEVFCFNFLTRGAGLVAQDGHSSRVQAGEFAIFSNTRRLDWRFPGNFSEFVLKVPRSALLSLCPEADLLTAQAFPQTPSARILMSLARGLVSEDPAAAPEAQLPLAQAFASLAASALRESGAIREAAAPKRSRVELLLAAKSAILKELSDCDLSPERIARELRLSVRTLYSLFEAEGASLMAWLWEARLDKAKRLLESPASAAFTIGEIAAQCGFKSQAHFSKRFREAYGMTPREALACGRAMPAERAIAFSPL